MAAGASSGLSKGRKMVAFFASEIRSICTCLIPKRTLVQSPFWQRQRFVAGHHRKEQIFDSSPVYVPKCPSEKIELVASGVA
ncbi:unnamed protein product [Soboliphyme baturini]|uniref:Secreted protein n=1 Tax=Soboliphyme baturini TaxID=241478 RepID=A0A183J4R9_9BILA|nr:unnamed protein product [Soboliphyme baturini]